MTEAEQRENDEAISRLKDQIVRGHLTVWERALRWAGVAAIVLSIAVAGYTFTVQQQSLDCQAVLLRNQSAQNEAGADSRQQLRDAAQAMADASAALARDSLCC